MSEPRTDKKRQPETFEVPVGTACGCDQCQIDLRNGDSLPNLTYCAGCGHAYLVAGSGMCTRCGSRSWLKERPMLPVAALKRFRVQVRRHVEQWAEVTVEARSGKEALRMAPEASDRSDWQMTGNDSMPFALDVWEAPNV